MAKTAHKDGTTLKEEAISFGFVDEKTFVESRSGLYFNECIDRQNLLQAQLPMIKLSDLRIWLAQNPNQRVADLLACFFNRLSFGVKPAPDPVGALIFPGPLCTISGSEKSSV